MTRYQIIMTAGGPDTVVYTEHSKTFKHDIPIGKTSILDLAFKSYAKSASRAVLVVRRDAAESPTVQRIGNSGSNTVVVSSPLTTQGALCSAMLAIDSLDLDAPLFIVPGDSYITGETDSIFEELASSNIAAGTLLFKTHGDRWSFARLEDKSILEMAEKVEISDNASTGVFYFSKVRDFVGAAEWVLLNNMRTGEDFYVSSAINYLVMAGKEVKGLFLKTNQRYVPMSSNEDIQFLKRLHEEN